MRKRGQIEITTESEDEVRVAFVTAFLHRFVDTLSTDVLKSPDKVSKEYHKIITQLARKYKVMLSKSQILAIYHRLVSAGKFPSSYLVETLLKNRSVRSSSGVLPISVATDGNNFSCAFDCHFCPNECVELGAERDISRSYLSSEGTFIRGAIEDFDAPRSVWRRLVQLEIMGHPPDKCEIIVLGGTWDCYDASYRETFIKEIFYACNVYHLMSLRLNGPLSPLLKEWLTLRPFVEDVPFDVHGKIRAQLPPIGDLEYEKEFNVTAPCSRIIGIVLETRPDQITRHSLLRKRRLGCTRVQLGIQSTNDEVLKLNNRGHGTAKSIGAVKKARDACFKVDGHLMPDLPGTTAEIDYKMIEDVFCGTDLQLDYCKLYPCLDLPFTKSREWKETGFWKPIAENDYPAFLEILCHAMDLVPPWTRVNRVQRDFPEAQEKNNYLGFVSETIKSNLQEMVLKEMKRTNRTCHDIRCREIRTSVHLDADQSARLFIRSYRANEGTEFFITVEIPQPAALVPDDAVLVGILRLRLPDAEVNRIRQSRGEPGAKEGVSAPNHYLKEFKTRLLSRVRELHVYGNIRMVKKKEDTPKGKKQKKKGKRPPSESEGEVTSGNEGEEVADASSSGDSNQSQHAGVGKFLMAVAERISWMYGFNELAVISGVGVREYYSKLGYSIDRECEGEYMVKTLPTPVVVPGQRECTDFLPLLLFGHTFSNADIQEPVSMMKVPRKFLPRPLLLDDLDQGDAVIIDTRNRCRKGPHFAIYSYPLIDNGLPELIILKAPTQPGPCTTAPDSLYASHPHPPPGLKVSVPCFLSTFAAALILALSVWMSLSL